MTVEDAAHRAAKTSKFSRPQIDAAVAALQDPKAPGLAFFDDEVERWLPDLLAYALASGCTPETATREARMLRARGCVQPVAVENPQGLDP